MTDPVVLSRLIAMTQTPEYVDQLLNPWLRRFQAVRDRSLRRTVMLEQLENIDDASLLAVLTRLDERARQGSPECRWLATELAMTPAVIQELPYDRLAELYSTARDAQIPGLAERFLGRIPLQSDTTDGNPHLDMPAGERTARARYGDRLTIDRLMHDRDARVIAALLENPLLIERDVVRIAAMRPTHPAILERIATHRKWGTRYRIRIAIAANPTTPPGLAHQISSTLLAQDRPARQS